MVAVGDHEVLGYKEKMNRIVLRFSARDLPHVDGLHRLPTKNRHLLGNGRGRTKRAREFVRCMARKIIAEGLTGVTLTCCYELRVLAYAPDRIRRDGEWYPRLDADACVVPVRDALQRAGLIEDDLTLVDGPCATIYRADNPGLSIYLDRVGSLMDRHAWIARMFTEEGER